VASSNYVDTESFCEYLASQIPSLRPLLRENVDDYGFLSHGFTADVARWFLENADAPGSSDDVDAFVALLEKALTDGPSDVQELVSVSFIEALPVAPDGRQALSRLSSALKADYQRWTGISL